MYRVRESLFFFFSFPCWFARTCAHCETVFFLMVLLFYLYAVRVGRCGIGRKSSGVTSSMPTSRSFTVWCRQRRPPLGNWTRPARSVSRPISYEYIRVRFDTPLPDSSWTNSSLQCRSQANIVISLLGLECRSWPKKNAFLLAFHWMSRNWQVKNIVQGETADCSAKW